MANYTFYLNRPCILRKHCYNNPPPPPPGSRNDINMPLSCIVSSLGPWFRGNQGRTYAASLPAESLPSHSKWQPNYTAPSSAGHRIRQDWGTDPGPWCATASKKCLGRVLCVRHVCLYLVNSQFYSVKCLKRCLVECCSMWPHIWPHVCGRFGCVEERSR